MEKTLAIPQITAAMEKTGLNQASIAQRLDISRETVSKWLKNETFPRPDKLLRLASLLNLSFSELVVKTDQNAPIVAFRKMRATKTTEAHFENAHAMGQMLKQLVPYLSFDKFEKPPVLKQPNLDYLYLQDIGNKIRSEIGVENVERINFSHLIKHFEKLQAVLIPVLWGSKKRHENAVHIFLPDSCTTWIYLNLDVNVLDFKFWIAHELGHCLAPELRGDDGEDFADAFAGALLFPHALAKDTYSTLTKTKNASLQIQEIKKISGKFGIAPFSIYCQVNAYAKHIGLEAIELEPLIHKVSSQVNSSLPSVSQIVLNKNSEHEADYFIKSITEHFQTPFFEVLSKYLLDSGKGPGLVQTLMDVSALDARSIHSELSQCLSQKF
jgi:transcriptional regulator with XRE-family HTH domain